VKAYVVLRAGASLTAEELHSWASDPRHGLSGYHVPKLIEFRESLPETTAGKVLRRELWTGQQGASGPHLAPHQVVGPLGFGPFGPEWSPARVGSCLCRSTPGGVIWQDRS
jgi:hypothetical protein